MAGLTLPTRRLLANRRARLRTTAHCCRLGL